jgi:peroxiredoxin
MLGKARLIHPQRRLPDLELPMLKGSGVIPIRAPKRAARLLLLIHGANCEECRNYVERLATHRAEITSWDGTVLLVVPDSEVGQAESGKRRPDISFPVAVDAANRLQLALSSAIPTCVIADQWSEIQHSYDIGPDHAFPEPDELIQWARYLAIRCPECEGEAL